MCRFEDSSTKHELWCVDLWCVDLRISRHYISLHEVIEELNNDSMVFLSMFLLF